MAASEDKKELSGLARSIGALFGDAPTPPPSPSPAPTPGEEMVWEPVQEAPKPARRSEHADPQALRNAVTAFLAADPFSREGKGRAVRDAALALREANALDVLADSVERLALGAGDPPDEACIVMAQSLVTPGVASRIAAYLGNERDEDRRKELLRVCQLLGHDMALAVSDALSGTQDRFARRTFLDTMVAMGPEAMPIVEKMAEDGRWFVVRNALAILGEIGGERPVDLIISTLAHTDARVRREALLALAKVGGEDAGQLVYGMIEDLDADVRLAAAMAAGELKVERALRPLLALLEQENDSDVVAGVLRALGQLGDPGAVNAIEKRAVGSFFSRPPADVRIAAYRALHNIGTPHAKSLIMEAADDKDPAVKGAVRQLLGMR
ncbi:MAG TPA: HEAT repeat domain-containing protein [Longimicrobiales bacterium]|nr:HEAT repeat domain-containing protein [Longimicrobiales bacterium]